MRKVEKDCSLAGVPESLMHPDHGNFSDGHAERRAQTTHTRRQELISAGRYIDEDKYNDRYKQEDVKEALQRIYKGKCAYCEMRVLQAHVDHYRPKSIYYWLAYSWDNLLRCCPTCNQAKGAQFEVKGVRAVLGNPAISNDQLHESRAVLDGCEKPELVNPEVEDLSSELVYEKDGAVSSKHPRLAYTIGVCGLDESRMRDERARIWQRFLDDLDGEELMQATSSVERLTILKTITGALKRAASDPEEEFTTFRRFMLKNLVAEELQKRAR